MNMVVKNTHSSYGLVTIVLHWSMAIFIIALFLLGLYMVELDYYSPWYVTAPYWHKTIGVLVTLLLLLRIIWQLINTKPIPLKNYSKWEITAAHLVHKAFYVTIFIVCVSGYLITTGRGADIEIATGIQIPAILTVEQNTTDSAGEIHRIVAWMISALLLLHIMATAKHYFIDKDSTLKRILVPHSSNKQE